MTNMEIFPTRLRPDLANRLREFSAQNDIPESIVVRLALRHFFDCEFGFPKMRQVQASKVLRRGAKARK